VSYEVLCAVVRAPETAGCYPAAGDGAEAVLGRGAVQGLAGHIAPGSGGMPAATAGGAIIGVPPKLEESGPP
jgi:hypothetical protein